MDKDLSDINLLPEDLRSQEEKFSSNKGSETPSKFHIPQQAKQSEAKAPPMPPHKPEYIEEKPVVQDIFSGTDNKKSNKEELKSPRERKKKKDKKIKPKTGFLTGLFKGIKKKSVAQNSKEQIIKSDLPKNGLSSTPLTGMDVNLIPEGTYLIPTSKILLALGLRALIALIVLFLIFFGMFFYHKFLESQGEQISLELKQEEESFDQYELLLAESELFKERIDATKIILEKHVYWTRVFAALERLTSQDVFYDAIAADLSGVLTLDAVASSYKAVARQYIIFQQATDLVENVSITGASGDPLSGKVIFSIVLQLKPDIFFLPSESLTFNNF